LTLVYGLGPSLSEAAEPPTIPPSFNEVAAAALAASFAIRIPVATAPAEDGILQSVRDADEDIQEDGHEPLDAAAELRERTVGAGVIIDPRGVALTSTRVVLQAREFEVVMMDGTAVSATVVGLDLRSDVAVLKLDGRGTFFPHLPLGDSTRVKIGDWLISVGAPLGLTGTVVAGVVTATPAPMSPDPTGSFLQSDAVMGLGNAGGPMVNMGGEVVGLGTVLTTSAAAYAIPSNTLRRIARDMLEKGRVSRPWLGITTQSLNGALARALRARGAAGALVADVGAGGPGAAAGLRPGDIIVGIGATPISSRLQFERAVSALRPGDVLALKVRRAGRVFVLSATLADDPEGMLRRPEAQLAKRRLGIEVRSINPITGAVANDVDISGSAGRAGIKPGDVIREVNGQPIRSPADFEAAIRTLDPGAPILMRVQRRDVILYIVVDSTS
jgi:S1-C subfamily serine protease